jgi:cell division transport system ATP-binding protein
VETYPQESVDKVQRLRGDRVIEYINVSKQYESNKAIALTNINLRIKKGEFVFIVGSSGAGKSSLIKLLLKEEDPTSGKLILNGEDITHVKGRRIPYVRRSIGVVFQDFRLLENKTVFENVAFAMEIVGATKKQIERQVPQVIEMVGLKGKEKDYPDELSGGEQQRVSIARAIVNKPAVLIADEPTGNLDPDTAWEIMKVIKEINSRGTTVVMATHAKDIVNFMKRRVVALEDGKIVRDEEKGVYGYEA